MPAMDGRVADRPLRQPLDHRRSGGRDVEELQVDEHALVASCQLVEHLEVLARGQQLHADLVERHAVAEAIHPLQCLHAVGHVQREDQALVIAQRQRRAAHGA
ncbi:hypothetical protein G6F68_015640 [Rhizopus microsporus]|uniref:Uncharacterized protein n=1 Tax=Rhizopus delemar TaxID=936053 RepID=A0A9P6Y2L4_9FUNG|nr:hypothetical protein G6F68_015640 [Rhizopus microsporus]KAG1537716.1 hypothetical protein G6F50_014808 [Rhizopus delemar]